ncbi:MAG: hypothetical protein WCQ95_12965 [Bacteroidota bacterium]
MKKLLFTFAILTFSVILISSCKKKETEDPPVIVADPVGTITTTMTNFSNVIIYEGPAENTNCEGYNYSHVQLRIGLDYNSLLTVIDACPSTNGGLSYQTWYIRDGAEVADVGVVTGLGSVTQKPTSGYTAEATMQVAHGYVIRFKKAFHLSSPGLSYFYSRFYVKQFLTNAGTGAITGAVITYQGTF